MDTAWGVVLRGQNSCGTRGLRVGRPLRPCGLSLSWAPATGHFQAKPRVTERGPEVQHWGSSALLCPHLPTQGTIWGSANSTTGTPHNTKTTVHPVRLPVQTDRQTSRWAAHALCHAGSIGRGVSRAPRREGEEPGPTLGPSAQKAPPSWSAALVPAHPGHSPHQLGGLALDPEPPWGKGAANLTPQRKVGCGAAGGESL